MHDAPSPNGENGRDTKGRFAQGNAGGPGNPHAQQVARFRARLFAVLTEADFDDLIRAIHARAKAGDMVAARLLLDRILGRPPIDVSASDTRELDEPIVLAPITLRTVDRIT